MKDKINSCEQCILHKYDRHNRVWICSEDIVRVKDEGCEEYKEQ
ncbi:hypothetical protein [Clostridium estertheticum]|nr:hypothetical protein [Clostridium estertheticum]